MNPPHYWHEAKALLCAQDPIMAGLIAAYPRDILLNRHDPFYTLARAIVGQQISIKAADALWQRLEALLETFSPSHYLEVQTESLRQIGLSHQKIGYIAQIAEAFTQGTLVPEGWGTMGDDAIAQQLKSIKGVGTWTAEMFMIFHLHRPDILPLSDLGLVRAINCHYGRGKTLSRPEMLELSERWQPYRTVATWYLWRSLDPVAVQY